MIKRVTLLRQRADLDGGAFRQHWAKPHAAIARKLPALVAYHQNHVEHCVWRFGTPMLKVDGIVELWFESEEGMLEARRSSVTAQLVEDEPRFLSGLTGLVAGPGMRTMSSASLKFMLLGEAEDPSRFITLMSEASTLAEFAGEPLLPAFTRPELWSEPAPPNVACTFRFDQRENAHQLLCGKDTPLREIAEVGLVWAQLFEVEELVIL